jgi:hypothetical protein
MPEVFCKECGANPKMIGRRRCTQCQNKHAKQLLHKANPTTLPIERVQVRQPVIDSVVIPKVQSGTPPEKTAWDATVMRETITNNPLSVKALVTLSGLSKGGVFFLLEELGATEFEEDVYWIEFIPPTPPQPPELIDDPSIPEDKVQVDYQGNEATANSEGRFIQSLDELLIACNVDLSVWKVLDHTVNAWGNVAKIDNIMVKTQIFQVKARLIRKEAEPITFAPIEPIRIILPPPRAIQKSHSEKRVALVLPDTQHGFFQDASGKLQPFHDERALELTVGLAEQLQPSVIVLLGDHLDLPDWSDKYLSSPDCKGHTQNAINALASWLGHLRNACPNAVIHYIEGNHEARLRKAVITHLSAAYNLKPANLPDARVIYGLENLLGLDNLKIQLAENYPMGEVWLNNKLKCVHGELVGAGAGATASKLLAEHPHVSVIQGHIHKQELLYHTGWERGGAVFRASGSPGCLCRIDPAVPAAKSRNNWQQGVFVVHLEDDSHDIEPVLIRHGKTMFRGSALSA